MSETNVPRPFTKCTWCGASTRATDAVCRSCARGLVLHLNEQPDHTHALYGGDWIVVRGVQRWVPWGVAS